jgi:hypothetical protein
MGTDETLEMIMKVKSKVRAGRRPTCEPVGVEN